MKVYSFYMKKDLVSILTPMYNTAGYVHRLLDSVLSQSYPYIEMIVIDDGSTDGSKNVVEDYITRFEEKGYSLQCVRQENSGQSVAVKNGLKLINGEFLVWPDSDDFYATNDAIEQMVNTLKTSTDEFQMVRTQERLLADGSMASKGVCGQDAHEEEERSLFEDCLFGRNGFYYCSGAYMVRTKALYETTNFDIYTAREAGQNWQLMLPILYKYRCKTILKPLYNVVVRASSHSRGHGYESSIRKFAGYMKTQLATLDRIHGLPRETYNAYRDYLEGNYNRRLCMIAVQQNKRQAALERLEADILSGGYFMSKKFLLLMLHIKGGTYVYNGITLVTSFVERAFRKVCTLVGFARM